MSRDACSFAIAFHRHCAVSLISLPFHEKNFCALLTHIYHGGRTTRLLWAFDVVSLSTPDPHSYVNHGLVRGPGKISFELRFRDKDARRLVEAEAAEAEERLKEWA